MDKLSARDRLAQAAFDLFNERGYEQTTIDDIAERAGLGRATFFRHYRSKEDVIFPDHDRLLDRVRDRLRSTGHGAALAATGCAHPAAAPPWRRPATRSASCCCTTSTRGTWPGGGTCSPAPCPPCAT